MIADIGLRDVAARPLAAVRRRVRIGEVARAWGPALDLVWAYLRANPGVRSDGHNIFLYHHPARRDQPMEADFGVEVARAFTPSGDVRAASTPAGRAVSALHVGPYGQMRATHEAIHAWAAERGIAFAGMSWEIYGDPSPDENKNETRIEYLVVPTP